MRIGVVVNLGGNVLWPADDHQVVLAVAHVESVSGVAMRIAVRVLNPFGWVRLVRGHQRLHLVDVHRVRFEHLAQLGDQVRQRVRPKIIAVGHRYSCCSIWIGKMFSGSVSPPKS